MLSAMQKTGIRRMWFVPGFMVRGLPGLGEIEYLVFEKIGSAGSVYFASTDIGDSAQTVRFEELTDHRGNKLPEQLASPRVLPRRRDRSTVFIVGEETRESFKIARDPDATGPVPTDLLILEMGE